MKFVIQGSAGYCGTDFCELVECDTIDEAYELGITITEQWCESYGVELAYAEGVTDEDIERWEEEGTQYVYDLDYSVVPYNAELHDGVL